MSVWDAGVEPGGACEGVGAALHRDILLRAGSRCKCVGAVCHLKSHALASIACLRDSGMRSDEGRAVPHHRSALGDHSRGGMMEGRAATADSANGKGLDDQGAGVRTEGARPREEHEGACIFS